MNSQRTHTRKKALHYSGSHHHLIPHTVIMTPVFTWTGNLITSEDQELMERQLDLIKPNTQSKPQKEGSEAEQFLGGKSEYPSQKLAREGESDPHLFSCIFSKGNLKTYLSAVEFREKFGMAKDVFYKLPKWKQNKLKNGPSTVLSLPRTSVFPSSPCC